MKSKATVSKKENDMDVTFRWSVFALALIATVLAAHMFRYEPLTLPENSIRGTSVWDRWNHRPCMTGMELKNKMMCTLAEWDEFVGK